MITIIYANRNRDSSRIKNSFDSLQDQTVKDLEVIFVDYGSAPELAAELENLSSDYKFIKFYHLPVYGLLWNKSKALNYAIAKANGEYVFVADVDLIFHQNTIRYFKEIVDLADFYLFELGYLEKKQSYPNKFEKLNPNRFGQINGMVLVSREALIRVDGMDEFFHFYGSEDEDLFLRLEHLGLKRKFSDKHYFYHQWHHSFSTYEKKKLTKLPRLTHAMRINQRHFNFNKDHKVIQPTNQHTISTSLEELDQDELKIHDISLKIPNIAASVVHFLNYEIRQFTGKTISTTFFCDPYYKSLKYRTKLILGEQTQPYLSMKQVNDLILKEIVFRYRHHNYSFKISDELDRIEFSIKL